MGKKQAQISIDLPGIPDDELQSRLIQAVVKRLEADMGKKPNKWKEPAAVIPLCGLIAAAIGIYIQHNNSRMDLREAELDKKALQLDIRELNEQHEQVSSNLDSKQLELTRVTQQLASIEPMKKTALQLLADDAPKDKIEQAVSSIGAVNPYEGNFMMQKNLPVSEGGWEPDN
ncbi:MAG: hypothetical protein ACX94C_10605 [Phycisphaerales bacterium]